MENVHRIISPEYYKSFSCSGSNCKYTCCGGWEIALTRDEYLKLKAHPVCIKAEKETGKLFKRNRRSTTDENYAFMLLDDNGSCPLLSEDHLCSLQLASGPEALSNTCKKFPRMRLLQQDTLIETLSLGCESVVQLLYQLPNGIRFTENIVNHNEFKVELKEDLAASFGAFISLENPVLLKYYKEIQLFCLHILQARSLELDDRVILLGIFTSKIEQLIKEGAGHKLPELLAGMMKELQDNPSSLKVVLTGENDKTQLFTTIAMLEYLLKGSSDGQKLLQRINKNIGVEVEMVSQGNMKVKIIDEKIKHAEQCYTRYLHERKYLLENITVSSFLNLNMPFTLNKHGIWENFRLFGALYHLMKFSILSCMADETDECFQQTVVLYSRALYHNHMRLEALRGLLDASGIEDLARMAVLIKSVGNALEDEEQSEQN